MTEHQPAHPYRDSRGRARMAKSGAIAAMIVAAVDAGALLELALADPRAHVAPLAADPLLKDLFWLTMLSGLLSFLFWLRRAYTNALACGLRHGPVLGYAAAVWFLPLVIVLVPPQAMALLWRHAGAERVGSAGILLGWIASWFGMLTAAILGSVWLERAGHHGSWTAGTWFFLTADLLVILWFWCSLRIMRRVPRAHEQMQLLTRVEDAFTEALPSSPSRTERRVQR